MFKKMFCVSVVLFSSLSILLASGSRDTAQKEPGDAAVTEQAEPDIPAPLTDEFDTRENKTRISIGVSLSHTDSQELQFIRDGINQYGNEQPLSRIQLLDAQNNAEQQLAHIETLLDRNADVVVVVPVDPLSLGSIIQKVREQRVALVAVHVLPRADFLPGINAYVGADDRYAGILLGNWVSLQLTNAGTAGLLQGPVVNESLRLRTMGLAQSLDAQGTRILTSALSKTSRRRSREIVLDWLDNGTEPDVIVSNTDELAIGAMLAAKERGFGNMLIAGIGTSPDILNLLGKGINATVSLNEFQQGYNSADIAYRLAKGESVDKMQWVEPEIITQPN